MVVEYPSCSFKYLTPKHIVETGGEPHPGQLKRLKFISDKKLSLREQIMVQMTKIYKLLSTVHKM
jgi:hypothetical protein